MSRPPALTLATHRLSRRSALLAPASIALLLALGVAPAAGLSFGGARHYPSGRGPVAVAVADFNGDGAQDLVTANGRASTVSVLLGDGNGRFEPKNSFITGPHPGAVAVADFNGDGKQDLVTASGDVDTVSVLLGDGSGFFAGERDFATGKFPVAVAVGDFNGDDRPDLVTANHDADTVSVLLGDGSGGFAAKADFATSADPEDVAVDDFNGDGKQDIATVFTLVMEDQGAAVMLNDGSGGFPTLRTFGTDLEPHALAVGDLNGDSAQDLVTAQALEGVGGVGVLLNDGAGVFAGEFGGDVRTNGGLICVALGDFNGDGRQDVASVRGSQVIILRGDGLGGLSKETDFAIGAPSADVAVGDFNGDGRPDLVTADYSRPTATVLLNGRRAAPIIRSLSPARGHVGAIVTLTGWHFGANRGTSRVWFGAKTATRYVHWSSTRIKVKVPRGTAKGRVAVTVKTAGGRSAARHFRRL